MQLNMKYLLLGICLGLSAVTCAIGTWQLVVAFLGALATFAVCAIMMQDNRENKDIKALQDRVEASSQEIKRLNLRLGFKQ